MVDLLRNELDELMGKDRNLPIKERLKRKEHYDDPDVDHSDFFFIHFLDL